MPHLSFPRSCIKAHIFANLILCMYVRKFDIIICIVLTDICGRQN